MALTAASRPLTAVTPAMTSPTWQRRRSRRRPLGEHDRRPFDLGRFGHVAEFFEVGLVRQDFWRYRLICTRDEGGELGLAVAVSGRERVGQEVETQGIDHEVLDRIVDPVLRREHGETPELRRFAFQAIRQRIGQGRCRFLDLLVGSRCQDRRIVSALPEE